LSYAGITDETRRRSSARDTVDRDEIEADALDPLAHRPAASAAAPNTGPALRLAAKGLTTQQIADRLYISPITADDHIRHIYAKIGSQHEPPPPCGRCSIPSSNEWLPTRRTTETPP
jgi:DNA-binding CsgD family transcriptional regulator